MTVSWGVLYYAFGVFLVAMQEELDWSRTALTGAYSVGLLVSALAAPLAGRWLDRHGPRGLMTLGSALGTGLLLAWASVEDLWVLYLVWTSIGLAMAATLYEPAFAVLAKWFERSLARALRLVTLAGRLASTIFLPLTAARTLAPAPTGAMSAALGGYAPVLWTLTFGSALAAVAMFMAQRLVPPLRSEPDMNGGQ